jgi:hypothetical protein
MSLTQTSNIDASGNTIISGVVTGPLTDTQLRASGVPVTGPLTDTQLRASGIPVTGPATDAQMRATPIAVTAAVSTTGTMTSVVGSVTSVTVLAANSNRRGLSIYNDSTAICRIAFAATASATAFTLLLQPNSFYENNTLYTGIITGIWASAAGNARVTELT